MGVKAFHIGRIAVGEGNRPLVIPEIGINHGGSLTAAKEMADAAFRAGARLVKHQTHIVEDEMSRAARDVTPGNADCSIYEVMERSALPEEEEREFMRYVEALGMEFISAPFSRAAADRLERFGVKAYKIGSGEMNHYPLLRHIAEFGKPMLVSTGMNDLRSIAKAVDILEAKGVPYALLHTTNLYPTPPGLVRLGGMQELMREFAGVPVGLSDHTKNNTACIAAMALGAGLVERHFTDRMSRRGPDIVCSMDEPALEALLQAAGELPAMLGGKKEAAREEQVTIDFAFATLVTTAPIRAGERFTPENLWAKRPGTGEIRAEEYEAVLGKTAVCDIGEDVQLKKAMVSR